MEAKVYKGITPDIPIKVDKLLRHLRYEADITNLEFLILCAVEEIGKKRGHYSLETLSSLDVINRLERNRDAVYRAIDSLATKNYIEIYDAKNPWKPRHLSLTNFGKITLKKICEGRSIIPLHQYL